MKSCILFLAILCAGAYVMFLTVAKEAADGPNWASDVCKITWSLCREPELLIYAAGGIAAFWLVMIFVSAIRE